MRVCMDGSTTNLDAAIQPFDLDPVLLTVLYDQQCP